MTGAILLDELTEYVEVTDSALVCETSVVRFLGAPMLGRPLGVRPCGKAATWREILVCRIDGAELTTLSCDEHHAKVCRGDVGCQMHPAGAALVLVAAEPLR